MLVTYSVDRASTAHYGEFGGTRAPQQPLLLVLNIHYTSKYNYPPSLLLYMPNHNPNRETLTSEPLSLQLGTLLCNPFDPLKVEDTAKKGVEEGINAFNTIEFTA